MDLWVKRGVFVLGALLAIYLIIMYVLPFLLTVLGVLAHIIGWIILIAVIVIALWFLIQKFR
ncbi:MAG: hypothetical protein LBT84_07265 [Spirochaetia bacterium]|nr:hypothetical protein [Spirochaetia bacterium]